MKNEGSPEEIFWFSDSPGPLSKVIKPIHGFKLQDSTSLNTLNPEP